LGALSGAVDAEQGGATIPNTKRRGLRFWWWSEVANDKERNVAEATPINRHGLSERARAKRRSERGAERGMALSSEQVVRGDQQGSRAAYVALRVARLERKVEDRVTKLEDAEGKIQSRSCTAEKELMRLRTQIDASGEVTSAFCELEDELAVATKGARQQLRACEAACDELYEERMEVWASLDEAEERHAEVRAARQALERRGLLGLRLMLERRRVSRSLRTFLQKVM